MPSQDLSPLYYTPEQLAQLLQPNRPTLSSLAMPVDTQQLAQQLYDQQTNDQENQNMSAQGYAAGGPVQLDVSKSYLPIAGALSLTPPTDVSSSLPVAQNMVTADNGTNLNQVVPRVWNRTITPNSDPQNYGFQPENLQVQYMKRGGKPIKYDIPTVSDQEAVKALFDDKSILDRYGVEPEAPTPERKPVPPEDDTPLPQHKPLTGTVGEPDDQGFKRGGKVGPSEAQKKVGNYKKMHGKVHGLDISVENPAGSFRTGKNKDGTPWAVRMPVHYGYIKGTEGADGDHVDAFVGHRIDNKDIHVIDQKDAETGKFDEHKVMMGFATPHDALHAYYSSFSDGKAHLRMGGMVSMTIDDFKKWVKHRKLTQKPIVTSMATGGLIQNFAKGGKVDEDAERPSSHDDPYNIGPLGAKGTPMEGSEHSDILQNNTSTLNGTQRAPMGGNFTPNTNRVMGRVWDPKPIDTEDYYHKPTRLPSSANEKAEGGLIQNFASGGSVTHRFKSFVPAKGYVPPVQHYRNSLGNDEMSKFRSALKVR